MHTSRPSYLREEDKAQPEGDTYHPKLLCGRQYTSALPFPSLSLYPWKAKHPGVGEAAVLQTLRWAPVLFPRVNDQINLPCLTSTKLLKKRCFIVNIDQIGTFSLWKLLSVEALALPNEPILV